MLGKRRTHMAIEQKQAYWEIKLWCECMFLFSCFVFNSVKSDWWDLLASVGSEEGNATKPFG